jgi:23S rRNA (cytosine1962-C5)-methyltransferase
MTKLYLKPGREKSLRRLHPWVFSGAVDRLEGDPRIGETVEIRDSLGQFLAWGAYSPESQISIRVWSWDQRDIIGPEFLRECLARAINFRRIFVKNQYLVKLTIDQDKTIQPDLPSAVRLVNAEADSLPGLIVDKYGDTLVLQCLSAGAERWHLTIKDLLVELMEIDHIYERSDADVRALEGLPTRVGPLYGAPIDKIVINENNLNFLVDIFNGHKTGFYLDQRLNREKVRSLARGKRVLDCFSYTGGFTLNALTGGAEMVTAVDSSSKAQQLALQNVMLNNLPDERVNRITADVFQQLRRFRDHAQRFDLIILDPPKFAPTASQVKRATRGYKDINLLALKLLHSGGVLVTFSCSGGVDAALFQKILAGAALDAGVSVQIVDHLEQSPDHPVALNFPESAYLKGLVLRVG